MGSEMCIRDSYIDWALPDTGIFPQVTNIYSKTLTSNIAIDGEDRWHGRLLIAHHDSKCFVLSWLYDGWITTYTLGVYLTERDRHTHLEPTTKPTTTITTLPTALFLHTCPRPSSTQRVRPPTTNCYVLLTTTYCSSTSTAE